MFKVIESIPKIKPDIYRLYLNAYIRCVDRIIESDVRFDEVELIERQRLVFYGVNMINRQSQEGMSCDDLDLRFRTMDFIQAAFSSLTPNEFETIFPIDKEFDGNRYERKDYFYTKKMIESRGSDQKIGHTVEEFLWDYQNVTVTMFVVHLMSTVSELRRRQGQKGIMEEFCEENGIDTYSMYKNENGKQYLQNNTTGEVAAVKKPKPRYLNVVK
ncbi:hypothetical protein [Paenibacillus sinopodophylli]|uniref:hypothetical protein n=1 Tax=Paenibacillus sinopodophylli TaxID=1837342 RepID=UPI00110CAD5D|nr:hypothetical protein [Paenibacillus sinopodophylli]